MVFNDPTYFSERIRKERGQEEQNARVVALLPMRGSRESEEERGDTKPDF